MSSSLRDTEAECSVAYGKTRQEISLIIIDFGCNQSILAFIFIALLDLKYCIPKHTAVCPPDMYNQSIA